MNKIFFIIGNYGVGKSTCINYPIIKKENIFINIFNNVWILGENICGADSLSNYKKENIFNIILNNKDKNIIITGNYYCQYIDYIKLKNHFKIITIYLNTNYKNNALRIAKRNKNINVNTYNSKLKFHLNLLKKIKNISKIHIIDNNKDIETVKNEIKIILYE